MTEEHHPKRRWLLGILSIFLLFFLYRVFTVYTVRSGECRPKAVDPSTMSVADVSNVTTANPSLFASAVMFDGSVKIGGVAS